jgi:hypothetical protein
MVTKLTVPMGLPKLPDPTQVDYSKPKEVQAFMTSFVTSVGQALMIRPSKMTPRGSFLMQSEDGTAWQMKVGNDGVPTFEVAPKRPGE